MKERLKKLAGRVSAWMDDLLFPEHVLCLCCSGALDEKEHGGVCPACMRALDRLQAAQEIWEMQHGQHEELPPGIEYVHAAYVYEAQARTLVHKLKYESVRAAALILAEPMAMLPSGEEEIIVPVPTDKGRQRSRGFNQATLLAEHIAALTGMRVCEALVRTKACAPQTGLTEAERRVNLVGCMAVRQSVNDRIRGRRILLVDDVYTTGATVQEAARALTEAGAKSVGVFAAARAGGARRDAEIPFLTQRKPKNHGIPDKNHGDL